MKNHQAVAHATTTLEKIRMVRRGESLNGAHKVFGAAYRLLDPDGQSPTVTRSGFRDFVHPQSDRLCTVRELARLQTFPDDYEFKGRRCDTYAKGRYQKQTQHEQLGNAVPPLLAQALAKSIRRQLIHRELPPGVAEGRERFARFFEELDALYPPDRLGNKRNPLDELIFIMISRRATEAQYVPAYRALRREYPRWQMLVDASLGDVEEILRPVGLAKQRARAIVGSVRAIRADFGKASLSNLGRWSASRAYHYLMTLPGVNDKTAKCVLAYALDRDVLPIDSHTLRVSIRLGLAPEFTSYHRAPKILDHVVPAPQRLRYHELCVQHGRALCTARAPSCSTCPLRAACPSAV